MGEFDNNFWMTFISIMTIGYGDYVPWVSFGKVTAVIVVFLGIYLTSIFVIGITSFLILTKSEEKALEMIDWLYLKD